MSGTSNVSRTYKIYRILDPDTNTPVYIGQTCSPLETRLKQHISSAYRQSDYPLYIYLRKLRRENKLPIIEVVETVTRETVDARERYWIGQYPNILNVYLCDEGLDTWGFYSYSQRVALLKNWKGGPIFESVKTV